MDRSIETRTTLLDHLAALLDYPTSDSIELVERTVEGLAGWQPELGSTLSPLLEHVESGSIAELEEAYTRTFDINPDCSLEIGWHLYGENYTRGAFLVEMRGRMRSLELAESAELPDHIRHVLQVVGRLPEEEARQLCRDQLLPALSKMRQKLPDDRPHACVLTTIERVVRDLFSIDEELTTGKEALPYFREIDTLPPGCTSQCGGMP